MEPSVDGRSEGFCQRDRGRESAGRRIGKRHLLFGAFRVGRARASGIFARAICSWQYLPLTRRTEHTDCLICACRPSLCRFGRRHLCPRNQESLRLGAYVKAAFDCYLPELAKKLGFRMPAAPEKQKELWAAISQRVAYHLTFEPEPWILAEKENSSAEPNDPAGTEGATERSKAADPEEESEDNGDDAGDDAGDDEQTAPLAPAD